jgi:hypothetical protein
MSLFQDYQQKGIYGGNSMASKNNIAFQIANRQ